MKKVLLLLISIFTMVSSFYASHLMGGSITYKHLIGDNYEVTLVIYNDCGGSTTSGSSQNITFQSASCGLSTTQTLQQFGIEEDVSQLCPTAISTCAGGTNPGVKKFTYVGTISLPPCSDWIIHWNSNARNAAITNLVNPQVDFFIKAELNNIIGTDNNSPTFFSDPTPYLCANQLMIFNHGASDIDGDSLYYSLSTPLTTPGPPGTPMTFATGYTMLEPMITTAGINLNPLTGEMCFTPSQAQISVVSVVVSEYRNNILIGTMIREMQVIVDGSCNNQPPIAGGVAATCGNTGGMNITVQGPSVAQTASNAITMCPLDSICFEISFTDLDPGEIISLTSNILSAIPGANFSISNNNTINPTATFCWYPSPLDSGLNVFSIQAEDNSCPIIGLSTFTYAITVLDQPFAGPDQTICGTQTAQLEATGGAGYVWSVLSGDPIVVGTNFSCNNCDDPIADPAVTTTYLLTSTVGSACTPTDTVTIFVVPDFSFTVSPNDTLCDFLTSQLNTTITAGSPTGTYLYDWNNEATLSQDSIPNPIASPLVTTTYIVEVTSPDGCVKQLDSTTILVLPPPSVTLIPGNSVLCAGENANFDIALNCDYTLQMYDSFGDGWNSMSLDIYEDGVLVGSYTILPTDNNGDSNIVNFPVVSGSDLLIIFNSGTFDTEGSFNLLDGAGAIVSSMNTPNMGNLNDGDTIYSGISNCGQALDDYIYSWSPGVNLSDSTIIDPILINPTNTLSYTVTVTDTISKCVFDRNQTITVVPDYTLTTTQSDTNICLGDTVHFEAITPGGSYNYSWLPAGIMNNNTIATPTATFTTPGLNTIIVTIGNGGGCIKTDTMYVNVSVGAHPTITMTPDSTAICAGGSAQLNMSIAGASLNCQENTSVTGQDDDPTTIATISNFSCVPAGSSITGMTLDATIGSSCGASSWYSYDIIINGTTQLTQQCDQTGLNLAAYLPITSVSISANDEDNFSDNVTLDLTLNISYSINPYNYTWTPSIGLSDTTIVNPIATPIISTTYFVTIVDTLGGCFDSDSVIVNVGADFTAQALTDTTLCIYNNLADTIQLQALPNTPGYTYLWSNSSTLNDPTIANPLAFPTASTDYIVSITSPNGCIKSDTASLTINNGPFTEILGTDSICTDSSINLTSSGGPFDSYLWNPSGSTFDSTIATPGVITLTVSNNTCSYTTSKTIYNYPSPNAMFTINPPISGDPNINIEFTDLSTNATTWLWNFDVTGLGFANPSTSTNAGNHTVIFSEQGQYIISLEVTNDHGCYSKYAENYSIISDVIRPNVFTPNGDNINDFLVFKNLEFRESSHLEVFNRWGNKVFEADNYKNDWNGGNLKDGTYFYVLDVVVPNEENKNYKGSITILR